jgi:hypothetical protein
MRILLLALVAVAALLVATNPTRAEFNDWLMQYAAQKVGDEARSAKRDIGWGERVVGGYSTGWMLSALPVARSNYVVFSIYRIDLPADLKGQFPACVLAVAGQFLPRAC